MGHHGLFNLVNGEPASQTNVLLKDIAKKSGLRGVMMSDGTDLRGVAE